MDEDEEDGELSPEAGSFGHSAPLGWGLARRGVPDLDSLNPPKSIVLNTGEALARVREQTTHRKGFTLAVPTARCKSPSGSNVMGAAGSPSPLSSSPTSTEVDLDRLDLLGLVALAVLTELVDFVRMAGEVVMFTTSDH